MRIEESRFTKSRSNRRTENTGLALLLCDPRFQVPSLPTKRAILELLPIKGAFGTRTFDAIMTPQPTEEISVANLKEHFASLRLVEMKTTREAIRNRALNGFFFGATKAEYDMARALADKYLFAFVVLRSMSRSPWNFGRST